MPCLLLVPATALSATVVVGVGVRASEQPRDGSAAFPWPWTACMVWPVMEPGDDGTCSTYACVCLPAAWNCACGTSAVVHACTHGYIRMFSTRMHGSAINAWFASCIYVRTYTSPFTCSCPCPIRRRRAGPPDAYAVPPIGSVSLPHPWPRVTRRPGGRRHARTRGIWHATVRVCIYAWPYVVPRAAPRAVCYSARPLLAAACQHTVLSDRSGHACMHVGASIIQGTRVCPIWHRASWTTVSRLTSCTLNFVFRLFLAESFFSFLRGLESALLETSDMARDIHVLYIQCTFSRSCSIALFVLLRLLGPLLTIGCSFF